MLKMRLEARPFSFPMIVNKASTASSMKVNERFC